MRVLVTYSADRLLSPDADLDPDELRLMGLGDEDSPVVLFWADPIESAGQRPRGEDERGIPVHRHPELSLAEDPEVGAVVDQWRCGVARELSRGDYAEISNWDTEAWLTMRVAQGREERRELERIRKGEEQPS